ncbi:hypothetical protein EYF80_053239 [Liparis tanakae]|uniref:Uncharacterized protein n=1 Tax=Liparis tanakae TaxID=230148 RepID=A0A4Z2F5Z8_9TELE|nr:hypothetical protein EYF80_053239 [Liparis tanakae]
MVYISNPDDVMLDKATRGLEVMLASIYEGIYCKSFMYTDGDAEIIREQDRRVGDHVAVWVEG